MISVVSPEILACGSTKHAVNLAPDSLPLERRNAFHRRTHTAWSLGSGRHRRGGRSIRDNNWAREREQRLQGYLPGLDAGADMATLVCSKFYSKCTSAKTTTVRSWAPSTTRTLSIAQNANTLACDFRHTLPYASERLGPSRWQFIHALLCVVKKVWSQEIFTRTQLVSPCPTLPPRIYASVRS